MGTNPSAYAITDVLAKRLNGQNFRGVDFAELPVENVDWFDCRRFANDLNALGVAPAGFEFRLPTFAEGGNRDPRRNDDRVLLGRRVGPFAG